jgi:hypothetical protein
VLLVKMTDSHGHLGRVELCSFLCESGAVPQMHKKFTSSDKPHNEEDLLLSLEYIVHAH